MIIQVKKKIPSNQQNYSWIVKIIICIHISIHILTNIFGNEIWIYFHIFSFRSGETEKKCQLTLNRAGFFEDGVVFFFPKKLEELTHLETIDKIFS